MKTKDLKPPLAYTTQELAQAIGCTERIISKMRSLNLLRGVLIGRTWTYSVKEVERFFEVYQGEELTNDKAMIMAVMKVNEKKATSKIEIASKKRPFIW